ncbi:MAG: GNAT family N-acetyltransferase [Oscillospiraceae bacterium]|nr:GNAT family N-acetyltransferase [Oscillospiraceae bacterium]
MNEYLNKIICGDCSSENVSLLAKMNQQLIEDEKAETNLNLKQLEKRMKDFINSSYKAFLFYRNENVIGYALCNMTKTPVYLRQFFICRDVRRKGYGKQAFHELLIYLNIQEIDLDVYSWNKTGISFWESLGFEKRCYNMRYMK